MVKAKSINLSKFLIKPFSHVNSQNGPERSALLRQGLRSQRTRADVCCVTNLCHRNSFSPFKERSQETLSWRWMDLFLMIMLNTVINRGNSGIYGINMSTLTQKKDSKCQPDTYYISTYFSCIKIILVTLIKDSLCTTSPIYNETSRTSFNI